MPKLPILRCNDTFLLIYSLPLRRSEFLKSLRLAAQREKVSNESLGKVEKHLSQVADAQNGTLAAQNLRAAGCPPLEEN